MRRTAALLLAGLLLAAAALSGCSDDPDRVRTGGDPGTTEPGKEGPTTIPDGAGIDVPADQVVLQVATGGGFVPVDLYLSEVPELTIYGDGRAIGIRTPKDFRYGDLIQLSEGRVDLDRLAELVARASKHRLFDVPAPRDGGFGDADDLYGSPGVTDMPSTSIRLQPTAAPPVQFGVYALTFDAGPTDGPGGVGVSKEQAERRQLLREFVTDASKLVTDRQPFTPDRLRVNRLDAGVVGRTGDSTPTHAWPGPDLDQLFPPDADGGHDPQQCAAIDGPDARAVLAEADGDGNAVWTWEGQRVRLVLRPLLPGEEPCPER